MQGSNEIQKKIWGARQQAFSGWGKFDILQKFWAEELSTFVGRGTRERRAQSCRIPFHGNTSPALKALTYYSTIAPCQNSESAIKTSTFCSSGPLANIYNWHYKVCELSVIWSRYCFTRLWFVSNMNGMPLNCKINQLYFISDMCGVNYSNSTKTCLLLI